MVFHHIAETAADQALGELARVVHEHVRHLLEVFWRGVHIQAEQQLDAFQRRGNKRAGAHAARHNITTTLWQKTRDDRVVLVDLAESGSTMRIHMSIGQRLPMYIAALGRCMAAHSGLTNVELRRKISELRWEDGPSFETYMRDVEDVRRKGYAVDNGNYVKGVLTVSSPILDVQRDPVMAVSVVGFATQFSENSLQALCEDLRERCREATTALSGGAVKQLWSEDTGHA